MEMMKRYNVLWFDDEFESLNIIKEKGKLNGIILHGYDNAKDGIEELRLNLDYYDAIVVDGKFYTKPGQIGDTMDDKALFNVGVAVESLSDRKKIPWFILSGQISFTKEKNRFADGFKDNKIYDKTNDEDINSLWADIKVEADKQIDTQIRHKYKRVFDVCADKYIGEEAGEKLFYAIKALECEFEIKDTEDLFTSLRKVIEKIFDAFNKIGILPDGVFKQPGWFNNSCKFLTGNHPSYRLNQEILHPTIALILKPMVQLLSDSSHISGDLKLKVDDYVKGIKTDYLYKSIVFQLCDIIIWYKDFANNHTDIGFNKTLFSAIETGSSEDYIGLIEQDSKGNFHCGEYLLSFKTVDGNFNIGDKIHIKESAENNNPRTKHLYPKFGSIFIKFEL
jgi:hypothetical protein